MNEGNTQEEMKNAFKVGLTAIKRWKKQRRYLREPGEHFVAKDLRDEKIVDLPLWKKS